MTHFAFDLTSLLIAIPFIAGIIYLLRRTSSTPYLSYSHLGFFSNITGKKAKYAHLPSQLYTLALILFLFAFLDPRIMSKTHDKAVQPYMTEGRALYFVLDVSSSMKATVVDERGKKDLSFSTKLNLLKNVTREFIEGRPQDLIGLIKFARIANIMAPLTLNHKLLLDELKTLNVAQTPTQDGTAIGYAIYKTASVLAATRYFGEEEKKKGKPSYDIKGSAIILVTDGFQNPNPRDKGRRLRTMGIEEAAAYTKEQGVKLYILNIDPAIQDKEFAPQRRLMTRSAEITGGKFFTASDSKGIAEIYDSINQIEESTLPVEVTTKGIPIRLFSFASLLIWTALIALTCAILSETLFFQRAP
ncbi:MAG: hypothetical protein K940chlam3_00999 [Chlamydiae bacterium]|nr:hypothetical protein [Chlamydiota bacterium]